MAGFAESSFVAAVVGAAAALIFTAARDWWTGLRRRRNVASAFAWELRSFERKVKADLKAAEDHKIVVFDPPFSESLYNTLLRDLPNLGGGVFLTVRGAYSQLRQVAYLKGRLQPRHELPGAYPIDNLFDAFVASTRQAKTRIEAALTALRAHAPRKAFDTDLPPLTDLMKVEELFYRQANR